MTSPPFDMVIFFTAAWPYRMTSDGLSTQDPKPGIWKCYREIGLLQSEQGFSSFFKVQFSEGNVKLTKIIIIKYLGNKFGKNGRKALSFKTHCPATSMHHRIPFWVGTTTQFLTKYV